MRLPSTALAALAVLTMPLAGCIYRMNIQQGNYLEGKTVAQLQVGMTRTQVRYLLGSPMVPDIFDRDRWDYLYYFKSGHLQRPEQRHLVVLFKEDKVASFKHDNIPDSAPRAPDNDISVAKFPKI
jgi:outer membrane protein assembly factor BamE